MLDPDSLNSDPDPAFQVNPDQDQIRIQCIDDQKLKKKYSWNLKKIFFDQGLHKGRLSYQEKPSALKREHPAL